jgi:hypothetical protein
MTICIESNKQHKRKNQETNPYKPDDTPSTPELKLLTVSITAEKVDQPLEQMIH